MKYRACCRSKGGFLNHPMRVRLPSRPPLQLSIILVVDRVVFGDTEGVNKADTFAVTLRCHFSDTLKKLQ